MCFECENCYSMCCHILLNQLVYNHRGGIFRKVLFQEPCLTDEKTLPLAKKIEMTLKMEFSAEKPALKSLFWQDRLPIKRK
ncbi:hypothetical protein DMENIID0001_049180 [Sergentomyia squamirostris]